MIADSLRHNASLRERSSKIDTKRLKECLIATSQNKQQSSLCLQDSANVSISNVEKLRGGLVNNIYSFLLAYTKNSTRKQLHLVMKCYVRNPYFYDSNLKRCLKEWYALTNLDRVGFAAPKPYLCERDSRVLGYPFVVMAKVEKSEKNTADYSGVAKSLARLHNLEIDRLDLGAFYSPKDGYAFAKRWIIFLKHVLNSEVKHCGSLRTGFGSAVRWLEKSVQHNYCPKYSLIHGDFNLSNSMLTSDSRITFIDWENAGIGDPAIDVAQAYNAIMLYGNPKDPDSCKHIADRFLLDYRQEFKGEIKSRFEFYRLLDLLALSMNFSAAFSSPMRAYKLYRRKVLSSIPFLRLPLILSVSPFLRRSVFARRLLGAEGDIDCIRYFEKSNKARAWLRVIARSQQVQVMPLMPYAKNISGEKHL